MVGRAQPIPIVRDARSDAARGRKIPALLPSPVEMEGQTVPKTTDALVPPKPNEFDSA
jgi:hypothetical protein